LDAIAKTGHSTPSPRDLLLQRYYLRDEKEIDLRDYWRIILKHRWTVLTFFVIIATTVSIYTFTLTPNYRASATIKIDRERPQILSFQEIGSVPTYDYEFMGTYVRLLQTRTLAKRVADKLKASGQPIQIARESAESGPVDMTQVFLAWLKNPFRRPTSSTPVATDPALAQQQASSLGVAPLLGMLTIDPVRGSNLVRISFTTPSPALSTLLANTWSKVFIEQTLELKFNATAQAGEWLNTQLQDLMAKLEQSEANLHDFAKQKGILTIGDRKDIVTAKLIDLSEVLTKSQGERIAKEALYSQSRGMGFESIPVVLENNLIASLKNDYYKQDSEYQRLSETYKPDYPKMVRMREGINQLKRRLDAEIRRVVDAIRQDFEASSKKERMLQMAVEEQKRLTTKLNQDFVQYDILKREVDSNRQLYASLLERKKQANISQALATSNVQIVDPAETPGGPFSPNHNRHVLFGILLGLTVGVGLAFFFDYLDNTVKSPEEMERGLGIPNLALIPTLAFANSRKELKGNPNGKPLFELIAHEDLRSIVTEAFRNLRTSILYSSAGSPPKSILFTSAQASEGKTGTAINTAITLSQLGGEVLLIDGDMRRPCCHKFLHLPLKPGLSDYLTGHADLDAVIKQNGMPNLHCIPAGTIPVNPAELLASSRMKETIDLLSQRFDYIIIDSPPALGVADALILSTMVKGVILIAHGGVTPRELVHRALKNLIELNANVLGSVLNNVDVRRSKYAYYKYYYSSHQYSDPSHRPETRSRRGAGDLPMRRQGGRDKTA
jgi:succinoglycan biosynthesis transport protein ExoP